MIGAVTTCGRMSLRVYFVNVWAADTTFTESLTRPRQGTRAPFASRVRRRYLPAFEESLI
jgi:hypothetical protein